nr:hypothetical protein [Tanacetum cinerariifolium]
LHQPVLLVFIQIDESSWIRVSDVSFLALEIRTHPEWFQQQKKPPTPDCAWNKTLPATHESIQPWISDLVKQADSRSSFNELMDILVDFSAFLMNRLNVDTLTPKLLAGLTYELMKGSCKSLVELKFFLEEVYKATTDQLDWNNPKGQRYPHNLLKPLPPIPNSRRQWKATITLKRCRDDENKHEEPSTGSVQGSKRRRKVKEPESTSASKEKATKTTGKSTHGSKSHQKTASESAPAEEPMQT